ncbi:MAG TPA: formimidoylglutamase [Phycisphaerales bacterium]|nr:formimidoylglutamase [Phycisphaerales bacterium]
MTIPHCQPGLWPADIPEARFAAHIHVGLPVGCQIALLGLPDDTGVSLNSGRPGASEGPAAFRAALARYGVQHPAGWQWPKVFDAGDILPAKGHDELALRETHQRIFEATSALLDLGLFPIAIGGGHDLTYPFVHAVARRNQPMTGVYFDAHLDVRAETGSGMPFRRLVEDCGVRSLNVFGLSPLVNTREHTAWFETHGGQIHGENTTGLAEPVLASLAEVLSGHTRPHHTVFASFDLDVLDAAHAPGVSALNPAGWTLREGAIAAELCGRSPWVRCFDIMELNPRHDEQGRTARAAVCIFLSFLRGFAARHH